MLLLATSPCGPSDATDSMALDITKGKVGNVVSRKITNGNKAFKLRVTTSVFFFPQNSRLKLIWQCQNTKNEITF